MFVNVSNYFYNKLSVLERVLLSIFNFFISLSNFICEETTPIDPINED